MRKNLKPMRMVYDLKLHYRFMDIFVRMKNVKGIGDSLPTITGLGMIIDLQEQKYFMTEKRLTSNH